MKTQPFPCSTPRIALPLLLAALLAPVILIAQAPPPDAPRPEEDVTLVLEGQGQRPAIRLAFPSPARRSALTGANGEAAEELEEVLRYDLDFSRYFEIQGPWAFSALRLNGDRAHDFEQYRSLGNEVLLDTEVYVEGSRVVVEGRLFDLASGEALVAKRYRGRPDAARRIAHALADEIVRSLTGRPSVALTAVAFTSDRTGFKEIYLMDYDGANVRRLTGHKSTSMSSSWRPDRAGVAYVSFWSGQPSIYFAQLPAGEKTPMVTGGLFNISPSFSPDGRRVAYTHADGANSDVYVANRDGSGPRRLTFGAAIDTNAAWSPTGNLIAFTSSRAGNPQIYLMDPEGADVRRLSYAGEYNDGASWSPDGRLVAYASRRGGVFQVAVTNVATSETQVLTSGRGNKEDPSFSPDGRHLLFSSDMQGGKQVYVMDLDGRNIRRLTREGRNESPAWSPFEGAN
jgi:TolB protein